MGRRKDSTEDETAQKADPRMREVDDDEGIPAEFVDAPDNRPGGADADRGDPTEERR